MPSMKPIVISILTANPVGIGMLFFMIALNLVVWFLIR